MQREVTETIGSRMVGPLAVSVVLGAAGLVAGPLIRYFNASIALGATPESRAAAAAISDLDVSVALLFGLISAILAFVQAGKDLVAEVSAHSAAIAKLEEDTHRLSRDIAPSIAPMLNDEATSKYGVQILREIGAFYKKIEHFDPRTKEACLEVVRDTLDDMDQLLRAERGALLTASQCIGLYTMLSRDASEFTLIERKPLSPTKHYSPNFIQFLRKMRSGNSSIRLTYILCCTAQELVEGTPKQGQATGKQGNVGLADVRELAGFFNEIGMKPFFVEADELAFVGAGSSMNDMFHLHFGSTVYCSVRPPTTNSFREMAFRFNIWNDATEPLLARWVRECRSLATTEMDDEFFRARGHPLPQDQN
jgi:hypothetical protein